MRKICILSAILPLLTANAHAQTDISSDPDTNIASTGTASRSFTPEDFAQFSPKTALEMVAQIPGFQIEAQDNTQRGFGQATGNVLINGQRLSGKSNDAVEALGRIPAASVVRIEVQDGAQLDIPGLSGQVVNIVTSQTGGISGAWTAESVFRRNLDPSLLNGTLSLSGKSGALDWTLSLENENPRRGNEGLENVFDGFGTLIETREEETRFASEDPSGSLALGWRPSSGLIANLNLSYDQSNFAGREIGTRSPVDQPLEDTLRLFNFGNDSDVAEISGDIEFGFGPGRLKLIGLQTIRSSFRATQIVTTLLDDGSSEGSRFTQDADELESIARVEYSLSPKAGRDWQISVEGAFNSLDNTSNLFLVDAFGTLTPDEIIDDNTRVEELRAEGNLTHSRRLGPTLNAQASLGVEYSELTQSGPTGQTRQFVRPKGFASLAWTPTQNTTISTRIEREVGQLDFFDFVSTVNLNQENEQAGNPEIVPQQAWLGEIELEQRLGDLGAFTIRTYGEIITDIVDQVPISDTDEARGNLDRATRIGIELNTTLKFDRFGAKGLQLEFDGAAQNSSLDDPLTGTSRRINRDLVSRIFTELRYDIPSTPYALGLNYNRERTARDFRLDQSVIRSTERGDLGVFAEHKDIFGLTGILNISNLIGQIDVEERAVSIDRRNNSPVDFFETRDRTFGMIVSVQLRGSF
ncbi:MAG: TonB-dependent receptor plug domain-containing protein [Hyphomonadaceae bacterium]